MEVEVRKIPTDQQNKLVKILESGDCWKRLMAIIPKNLPQTGYECDVGLQNLKYRSDHFSQIEKLSIKVRRSCPQILLYEWGSIGKRRPNLGHLLYLLQKAQLYRAADFVAVELLNQAPPERPETGEAARVTIPEIKTEIDPELRKIEQILDEIDYPSSAIEHIKNSSLNTNINYSNKIIPEIVISETPDEELSPPLFTIPIVVQSEHKRVNSQNSTSDLMKFSTETASDDGQVEASANLPHFSSLLNNTETSQSITSESSEVSQESASGDQEEVSQIVPQISSLLGHSNSSAAPGNNVPNISLLNNSSFESNSTEGQIFQNIPAVSALNLESASTESDDNLPALSQLIPSVASNRSTAFTMSSDKSSVVSRSCTSPLPNLSLNTSLPHVPYSELAFATNNFDENPMGQSGRYLGGGGFGKVYLALGLREFAEKPVAVKKLKLEHVDVVRVDDDITKQFTNEVEVLSKYKHDNLLSLLGYSCDGPTYCLMYEYIPGGALKDKLEKHERLLWTDRLYIAIGTARAISYLHTAFATPLIHRDIKTANILLDFTNKPKLCDFGLIKLSPTQNTTKGTTILGTSAYMAPDAFRGDISVKLDTFSFGVVLLELLTSLPPMDENREGVDLVTHVEDQCEDSIGALLDTTAWTGQGVNVAEDFFKIATRCLKDKKKRPSMVEVTAELTMLMEKCS